jgi:hypothetical protein
VFSGFERKAVDDTSGSVQYIDLMFSMVHNYWKWANAADISSVDRWIARGWS